MVQRVLSAAGAVREWLAAGFEAHPTTGENDPSYRWSLLYFRWGLTAAYVFITLAIRPGQDLAWAIATIVYLVVYHLGHTVHTAVHLRRGRPVTWFWEAIPFADVVVISLIMVSVPSVTFPVWAAYLLVIFGASVSRRGLYVLTLTGASVAGYWMAVAGHLGVQLSWSGASVVTILLAFGGWFCYTRAQLERALFNELSESKERFRRLVETVNAIPWELDLATWRFTYVGPQAVRLLGYPLDRWYRDGFWADHLHPDDREAAIRFCQEATSRGEDHEFEYRMVAVDGRVVWLRDVVSVVGGPSGPRMLRGVMLDVTVRKRAEDALRQSEAQFRRVFEDGPIGMAIVGSDLRTMEVNKALCEMLGYSEEELTACTFADVTHPDDVENDLHLAEQVFKGEIPSYKLEKRYITKDGEVLWGDLTATVIRDNDGNVLYGLGMVENIAERKRAEETVRHLAYHDALTGLPNRALFTDRLILALAQVRRSKQMLSVMFLDLDRFKLINDTLGHAGGDEVVQGVGEDLIALVREGDTVARVGGDEFTVLLTAIGTPKDATDIAERILESLRKPRVVAGHEFHVTVSIGLTIYPTDGRDAETLLSNADTAMYRAKDQGRDNYQLYLPAMSANTQERLALQTDLRRALERDEFEVYYQPQVNVRTQDVVGAEALCRWRHPQRGLVLPDDFIPLAEDTGLIVPLGEWVLRTACAQNKAWQDAGFPPISVTVNLSSRQFQQANLVEMVDGVLKETGLAAKYLRLEITEGAIMRNVELTVGMLQDLRTMGVEISIDDFGTGYSSLNYLKRLPIDEVKIDRSFVDNITSDPDDAAIVSAMIALAQSLKLRAMAEGVETEEQVAFLRERECYEMQGFLLGRPVPAAAFEKMLTDARRPPALAPARRGA